MFAFTIYKVDILALLLAALLHFDLFHFDNVIVNILNKASQWAQRL
jgi:hypothetical protein